MTAPLVDVQSTDYHNQIYSRYTQLRRDHPVYFDAGRNIWMISRYDDVRHLLRHPEGTRNGDTGHSYIPSLATTDGELHDNVRREVIPEFSKGVVAQLAPMLDQIVTEQFTVAGNIEQSTFNIKSKFGELVVKLQDIKGVERVSEGDIDLVVMDLQMP